MSVQNIVLLTAGIINLIMSIFIFSRGWKNKVNLYFSLLTLFTFFWATSLALANVFIGDIWRLFAQLAYPASLGIAIFLFFFTHHFPFRQKKINGATKYLIWIPAIFFSTIIFIDKVFITHFDQNLTGVFYKLEYNNVLYILFAVYFFVVVLAAVYNLINKYKSSEILFKKQILFLLFTIVIGLALGSYFDLITCYFGNFDYVWVGPPFTLLMNFAVFYLIFSANKEK
jgi:hypothetical protein